MLKRQSVAYPLVGAALAAGAPLGLLFMRRFLLAGRTPMRQGVRDDIATYAYVTTSTTLALTLFGHVVGRSAERLSQLSTTDSLTGLLNPRAFYPRLQIEMDRARRSATALTLLLVDLDWLKALNDDFGHSAGDRALQSLSTAIRREMRSVDVAARLGGDEFGLLAVGTTAAAGQALAQRLQTALKDEMSHAAGVSISASIGVVTFDAWSESPVSARELMRAADRALYDAKRRGRNRIAIGRVEGPAS